MSAARESRAGASLLARILKGWLSLFRGVGALVLLSVASAALAALIAVPLWAASTSSPRAYSLAVLALAAAGAVFLAVRSGLRARRIPRDPSRPRRTAAGVLVRLLGGLVLLGGLYGVVFLFFRGAWAAAVPAAVAWLLLAGWAAFAAPVRKARKVPSPPADIVGE